MRLTVFVTCSQGLLEMAIVWHENSMTIMNTNEPVHICEQFSRIKRANWEYKFQNCYIFAS